jgi:transposase
MPCSKSLVPTGSAALGTVMSATVLLFLSRWSDPHQVLRLGRRRLTAWLARQSHGHWREGKAEAILNAAKATLRLWGSDGMDFTALGADIATEAELALDLDRQIKALDKRIATHYDQTDPEHIALSAPGVGRVLAAQIVGRLGDPQRFTNLAAVRSYSGLVPRQSSSGVLSAVGGPTKQGDACLREALFLAADQARSHGSHPGSALSPPHGGERQAPHLRRLLDRRRAAHPDRGLLAQRRAL